MSTSFGDVEGRPHQIQHTCDLKSTLLLPYQLEEIALHLNFLIDHVWSKPEGGQLLWIPTPARTR